MNKGADNLEMHKRRITLADGRYMIFYTFGDEEPRAVTEDERESREPEAVQQAEEERGV
jgi:hypothetical protein